MGWYKPQPFNISEEMRKKQKAGTLTAKALELRKQANAVKAVMAEAVKKFKAADDKATKAEKEAAKAGTEKTNAPEGDSGGEGKE